MMRSTGPLLSSRCAPTMRPAMSVVATMTATRTAARRVAMVPEGGFYHPCMLKFRARVSDETVIPAQEPSDEGLLRALGLGSAVLFVVGSVIGSGIFLTTGLMAKTLPSPALLLLAW